MRWAELRWHFQVFDGNACYMVFILASRSFNFCFAFRCCIQVYAACGRLEHWEWGGRDQVGGGLWPTPGPSPGPAVLPHRPVS